MEFIAESSGSATVVDDLVDVLTNFLIIKAGAIDSITPIGTGLIHGTWKVQLVDESMYVLQRVNQNVFPEPSKLTENIDAIASFLRVTSPDYQIAAPVRTSSGSFNVERTNSDLSTIYYRLFPFIMGSHVHQTVASPELAFEASKQFAKFSRVLGDFNLDQLHITLEGFHDLSRRFAKFEESAKVCQRGQCDSIAWEHVQFIRSLKVSIVGRYEHIVASPVFKRRVMHHDTKISNVLFSGNGVGLCVIDLDTVMPGLFISDVGDMIRTYVCPVDENEADFSKITLRDDYLYAIVEGYLTELGPELSTEEKGSFVYAGKFMLYMQALRFLADYLDGDVYYPIDYPTHNLVRAGNQITLLQQLIERESLYCANIATMYL